MSCLFVVRFFILLPWPPSLVAAHLDLVRPMTIRFSLASIRLLVLALSGPAIASPALAGELTPFEVFQSLKGAWMIRAGDNTLPFDMTYAVGSNGTIVTEQFGKELSVFYNDGGSFVMTHFCNRGNQPRLKLKSGGPLGVTNSTCLTSPISKTPRMHTFKRSSTRFLTRSI